MTDVTLIPGDGIGPEVAAATTTVVDRLGAGIRWEVHEAGAQAIAACGSPLPKAVVDSIARNGVALKGPVTTPVGSGFRSVNVALRQELDLFASIRPCRLYPGVPSPFESVDIVVVRENTEDLYEGIEFERGSKQLDKLRGYLKYMHGFTLAADTGVSIKPISVSATRAIVEFAFDYARRTGRSRVALGHKANIMKHSDGVWLETAATVAAGHDDVALDAVQVDELAMSLAWRPEDFEVIVLPNLYGDIVSDLCAGLVGGLGVAPGMNLGKDHAIFEPTHGSAPDIAGRGLANPTGMMLSAVLMLRHLSLESAADRLEHAVARVLSERRCVPGDLRPEGPAATTDEFADAVLEALR